jgi:hypothetical protein
MLSLIWIDGAFCQSSSARYGVGASFGIRNSSVESNLGDLSGMKLYQEGGSLEAFMEKGAINARVHVGYFSSGSSVKHTIDLLESGLSMSFHPFLMQGVTARRVSPYIVSALMAGRNHFYGFYADEDTRHINYSRESAPYVGKVMSVHLNAGMGLQYRLVDENQYMLFFAEVQKPIELYEESAGILSGTSVHGDLSINIGLAFGF